MFEWIEQLMEATGCDWDTAAREYDAMHNPDYDAADYDEQPKRLKRRPPEPPHRC